MRFATRQSPHVLCSALIVVSMSMPAWSADEAKIKQLLKERLSVLNEVVAVTTTGYQAGRTDYQEVFDAQQAVCKAEFELCETDAERIAVLEKRLALAKQGVEHMKRKLEAALVSKTNLLKALAEQLKIEVALERLKGN